jgi:CP family cyanate transporter-like MFS transporter
LSFEFPPTRTVTRPYKFAVLTALLLVALILRSPLAAIAPIVGTLRTGFHASSATIGLLTGIPVLCFGLLTPLCSALIARLSIERAIYLTLGGTVAGLVLRSAGGIGCALAGTVVIGIALTIGNIVSLLVIARDFPAKKRMVTGLYTSAINIGTMASMALTAPLAAVCGWRAALASTAILAIPAAALWIYVARLSAAHEPRTAPQKAAAAGHSPAWKRPLVWLLVLVFAAHQSIFYSLTAWMPDYLVASAGTSVTTAGLIGALMQILALLGSFGAPLMATRMRLAWILVIVAGCWATTPAGLLLLPTWWPLWTILGGFASGGGFTVIFVLIMTHARDLSDNRAIASIVQSCGYTVASMSPMLTGHLHQSFGSWTPAFATLSVIGVVMLASGLAVTRIK